MYLCGVDEAAGVIISVYGTGPHSEEEYERAMRDVERVDAHVASNGGALVHFVIEERGSEQPPAKWRRRFAEQIETVNAMPYYFVFVSESALLRGAFTAVNWLRRERPGHHLHAFSSFASACAWLRESTSSDYPKLESLLAITRSAVLTTVVRC